MSFLPSQKPAQQLDVQRMIEREVQPVLDAHPGEEPLQDAMRTIPESLCSLDSRRHACPNRQEAPAWDG